MMFTPATASRRSHLKTPSRKATSGPALQSLTGPRKSIGRQQLQSIENRVNEENVKVAIRIRPLTNPIETRSFRASTNTIIESTSNHNPLTTPRRVPFADTIKHVYDNVFSEETDTSTVYNGLVRDIVNSVKDGINGTVFTYGQTSSGKTYTMQGVGETPGIIQYAARDIFDAVQESNMCTISYVEIYNEELRDLLINANERKVTPQLVIREDNERGTMTVKNLKEVSVKNLEQLMQVFRDGELNKTVGSTRMNDRSSRSHSILRITIEKKTDVISNGGGLDKSAGEDKENNENSSINKSAGCHGTKRVVSTLNLVDLAGSESVRLTEATGIRKKEGEMINKSLTTLSIVLEKLGEKNPGYINYRDSKLTRILKPSLSGNARLAVICCVSASSSYVEETRSTLKFATRAKLVKTHAAANEVVESDADEIHTLRLELEKARATNGVLTEELEKARAENKVLTEKVAELENAGINKLMDSVSVDPLVDPKELNDHKRVLFQSDSGKSDKRLDEVILTEIRALRNEVAGRFSSVEQKIDNLTCLPAVGSSVWTLASPSASPHVNPSIFRSVSSSTVPLDSSRLMSLSPSRLCKSPCTVGSSPLSSVGRNTLTSTSPTTSPSARPAARQSLPTTLYKLPSDSPRPSPTAGPNTLKSVGLNTLTSASPSISPSASPAVSPSRPTALFELPTSSPRPSPTDASNGQPSIGLNPSAGTKTPSTPKSPSNMPESNIQKVAKDQYVGARIAKYFGPKIFLGTVTSTVEDDYHVLYEDGDEEDLSHDELLQAIHLNKIRYVNNGSRVAIKRGNELLQARVCKGRWTEDGEEILVHYDGNKATTKSWVSVSLIDEVLPPVKKRKTKTSTEQISNTDCTETVDLTEDDDDEAVSNVPIQEGQNVWVTISKHEYPAKVESISHPKATVRFTSSNQVEEVDLDSIVPMDTWRQSKRKRRPTNKYLPE